MTAERWRRVDSLLAAALELPDVERLPYLDRSCHDADLRGEVERLLAADHAAGDFLETPPLVALETALAGVRSAPPAGDLAAGTAVGRYRIEGKIGEGGMARVYAARDPELDRTVALKLVHVDEPAGRSRRRLLREAQALARVSDPHVVTVHDVGSHGDDVFLAMEHVRGGTLADWLAARRRGWREIVAAFAAAGRGLAAAHAAGIVHRDFKPSNVLRDEEGRLRVADFGLAQSAEAPAERRDAGPAPEPSPPAMPSRTVVSGTACGFGTPSYMAPEQHAGGTIGPATDQFAFCVALYQALYGEHPFGAGSLHETRQRVLAGEVATAPRASRVPRRLRAPLLRGLAVRPEERWPSMMHLVRALERRSVDAHPARSVAAAAAALVVAAAGLVTWSGRGGDAIGQPAAPRSLAVLPFAALGPKPADDSLGEGITDELIVSLGRIEGLRVPGRASSFALAGNRVPIAEIGERLGVEQVLDGTVERSGERLRVTARLRRTEDGRRLWSHAWVRPEGDLFAVQEEIARAVVAQLDVPLPGAAPLVDRGTESLRAYSLYLRGRSHWNQRTAEGLKQAVAYFERSIAEDPDYALAYSGLADAYNWMPTYDPEADPDARAKAHAAARRAVELAPSSAEAHASLGMVLGLTGDLEAAEDELRRAIRLSPRYPTARHWYGTLLIRSLHRPRAGVAELERARELDPASSLIIDMLGQGYELAGMHQRSLQTAAELAILDPEWSAQRTCIARTYFALGRWSDAIASVAPSGELDDRRLGCLFYVVQSHHLLGDYPAELALARSVLRQRPGHVYFVEAEGGALAAQGRVGEAVALFDRVLAEAEPGSLSWYAAFNIVGELRVHGHPETARALARKLAHAYRQSLPLDHHDPASTELLAIALFEAGRSAEGARLLASRLAAGGGAHGPRLVGLQGWAAALQGRRDEAHRRLAELGSFETESVTPPYEAMIRATLGDRDAAIAALARRLDGGLVVDRELHTHVGLQPLRGEPAFDRMLPAGPTPTTVIVRGR